MSDEDRDIDIESDEDDDMGINTQFMTQAEKRAHHNALERKRRDHIKESFHSLRDSVPSLQGEKSSRAQILKQATDYIAFMCKKNNAHLHDIDDLKRQNQLLDQQVRLFEKTKAAGTFAATGGGDGAAAGGSGEKGAAAGAAVKAGRGPAGDSSTTPENSTPPSGKHRSEDQSDTSDSENEAPTKARSRKKLKT